MRSTDVIRYYTTFRWAIPEHGAHYPVITHPSATSLCAGYPMHKPVRLACLSHAASVRSEPGSNSSIALSVSLRKQVHAPASAADEQGLIQTHQPSIPTGDRKPSRVRMHERTGTAAPVTHQISAACGPRGPAPASHSHGSSTVHLSKSAGTSAAPIQPYKHTTPAGPVNPAGRPRSRRPSSTLSPCSRGRRCVPPEGPRIRP
jgi:hypothetical protein